MMNRYISVIAILLGLSSAAFADVRPRDEHEAIEPEVTIVEGDAKTIHIHKVNGQIYAIKVEPKSGKTYFLVDDKGDGNFIKSETHEMLIPQWVLFEWKN